MYSCRGYGFNCNNCSYEKCIDSRGKAVINDMKIKDKVVFLNHRNGNEEVGEIQLIAKVEECCITVIVGSYVYYVNSSTGGETLFRQNFKRGKSNNEKILVIF